MIVFESATCGVFMGDCLDVLRTMPDHFVESIVTDPPYGLSFMGKKWDYDVPNVAIWTECLRVLKPGGHLLAFSGSRTYHRMVVNIEDAGFEVRDQIMWVYGCLSEDTEVLTRDGWERHYTARTKEILAYDPEADIYQWERPERWSIYRVEQDTAYLIRSNQTDQIVSRNHRCLVERGGSLVFVAAEECADVERVPYLQGGVPALPQRRGELLLETMLRQGEGLAEATLGERQGQEASGQGIIRPKKPCVERWDDLLQEEGQVRGSTHQVRSLPCGVHEHGPQGRIRHGASANCGDGVGAVSVAERVCASCQPRCNGQPAGEPDVICVERGPQATRVGPSYLTTLATVTPIEYTGDIFCPTVSTGAFVARRNGKVFMTGNSGFPKSMDVSKAIDKAAGAEREVIQEYDNTFGINKARVEQGYRPNDVKPGAITAPSTDAAKQWDGWGTALKPAHEPIVLARKPLIGTVAENVLTHGTGAINVDGCRVPTDDNLGGGAYAKNPTDREQMWGDKAGNSWVRGGAGEFQQPDGRFPANLIHDGSGEVLALFPESKGQQGDVKGDEPSHTGDENSSCYGVYGRVPQPKRGDSGSAARFFYCAKAAKKERRGSKHPTVKPIALMRYLVRLITPPDGTVLDPFAGTGTTGEASHLEGFNSLLIEQSEDFVRDIIVRMNAVTDTPNTGAAA